MRVWLKPDDDGEANNGGVEFVVAAPFVGSAAFKLVAAVFGSAGWVSEVGPLLCCSQGVFKCRKWWRLLSLARRWDCEN